MLKLGYFFHTKHIIHFFNGNESKDDCKNWIKTFAKWCCQERIACKKKLPLIMCTMIGKAKEWCDYFKLETTTFRGFYFMFLESFAKVICVWGGEIISKLQFPCHL
jgi:hypothetical protein